MQSIYFIVAFWIIHVFDVQAQVYDTLIDRRDGRAYSVVGIGKNTWMAENLGATKFKNGDPIAQAKNATDWVVAGNAGKPIWAYYNFESDAGESSIKLYNWFAVTDKRGLAPEGWRIPSFNDWNELAMSLGGELVAGGKMKSRHHWKNGGNGTNNSGFSALPTGFGSFGYFDFKDGYAFWWSITAENENQAWVFQVMYANDQLLSYPFDKKNAYSIRCIKD